MTVFEIRQCTDQACGLRMPIDPEMHRGAFCPLCGAPMTCVVPAYQSTPCSQEAGSKTRQVEVILDNIRSAYNVGAIFRTADGVGVKWIRLCGITPIPGDNPAITKTALGAEDEIPWTYNPDSSAVARDYRKNGYHLLALECTPHSVPINKYLVRPPDNTPVVLIVGNERAGVDPGLIDQCDSVLALPMVGRKASLNVAVAFGVAAYWLSFT